MRLLLSVIGIILFGFLAQLFLPWWSLMLVAAAVAFLTKVPPLAGFWSGLLAGIILWGIYAAVINSGNDGLLASKIGALFGGPAMMVVFMTALWGGLTGALGALCGSLLRGVNASTN